MALVPVLTEKPQQQESSHGIPGLGGGEGGRDDVGNEEDHVDDGMCIVVMGCSSWETLDLSCFVSYFVD